jgi:hypothetical protein
VLAYIVVIKQSGVVVVINNKCVVVVGGHFVNCPRVYMYECCVLFILVLNIQFL